METNNEDAVSVDAFRWSGDVLCNVKILPSYQAFLARRLMNEGVYQLSALLISEDLCFSALGAAAFSATLKQNAEDFPKLFCCDDRDSEKWEEVANKSETSVTCPVCMEVYDDNIIRRDGPMNHPWPTLCTHWACEDCWLKMGEYYKNTSSLKCPICRGDVSKMVRALKAAENIGQHPGIITPRITVIRQLLGPRACEVVRSTLDGAISVIDLIVWATNHSRQEALEQWHTLETRNPTSLVPRVRYVILGQRREEQPLVHHQYNHQYCCSTLLSAVVDCEEALKVLFKVPGLHIEALTLCARIMIPPMMPMFPRRRIIFDPNFILTTESIESSSSSSSSSGGEVDADDIDDTLLQAMTLFSSPEHHL
jgi:hypothetical protein